MIVRITPTSRREVNVESADNRGMVLEPLPQKSTPKMFVAHIEVVNAKSVRLAEGYIRVSARTGQLSFEPVKLGEDVIAAADLIENQDEVL